MTPKKELTKSARWKGSKGPDGRPAMAKQNTTTKQASGRGFSFENEVVAYVLAHAAADLVFDGLIWLDRGFLSFGDRFWGRHSDEAVFCRRQG